LNKVLIDKVKCVFQDASFRLTSFADLKGWGCKVPQAVLLRLLEALEEDQTQDNDFTQLQIPKIGEISVSWTFW
jgi:hypothetical protein